MKITQIAVALLLLLGASEARSSEPFLWDVYVVLRVGTKCEIRSVPIVEHSDVRSSAARIVFLTTAPTEVMMDGQPQNRNAANLAKLTSTLVDPGGSSADTLHVRLAVGLPLGATGVYVCPEIVQSTIECLRRNVRACCYPDSRYLAVEVVNLVWKNPEEESLGGTFSLEGLHN